MSDMSLNIEEIFRAYINAGHSEMGAWEQVEKDHPKEAKDYMSLQIEKLIKEIEKYNKS